MSVEVHLEPGALARFLRLRGGIVERRLSERTERVADIVRVEAPGRMGRRVDWYIDDGPRGLRGVVTCDHPAVFFVLDGTRPHIIRPRRRRALRFHVDGREVFAAYVRHPGTDPNDFMFRALRLGR